MKRSIEKDFKDYVDSEKSSHMTRRLRGVKAMSNSINLINCHCCKLVDSSNKMVTCSKLTCRESYCLSCIKKTYFKFNDNFFYILKEKEAANDWKCYKCNNKCPCITCEKKLEKGKMLGMKRGASRPRITVKQTKSRRYLKFRRKEEKPEETLNETCQNNVNNINTASSIQKKVNRAIKIPKNARECVINKFKILEKEGKKEKIKIGEFLIYECEDDDENFSKKSERKSSSRSNSNKSKNYYSENISNSNYLDSAISSEPLKITNFHVESQLKEDFNNAIIENVINESFVEIKGIEGKLLLEESQNKNQINIIDEVSVRNVQSAHEDISNSLIGDCDEKNTDNLTQEYNKIENIIDFSFSKDKETNQPKQQTLNENHNVDSKSQFNEINNTNRIKKPLTKPCNVCGNSHLEKSEITKFSTFADFIKILQTSIDNKKDTLTDLTINVCTEPSSSSAQFKKIPDNSDHLDKLKSEIKLIKEGFQKGTIKQDNHFKRTKRICNFCLSSNLEKEKGISVLLDSVLEEDEKPELDTKNKKEILRNINSYMLPLENFCQENIVESHPEKFNIFDNIFGRKKFAQEMIKINKTSSIISEDEESKLSKAAVSSSKKTYPPTQVNLNNLNNLSFLSDNIFSSNFIEMKMPTKKINDQNVLQSSNSEEECGEIISLLSTAYSQYCAFQSLSTYNNLMMKISFSLMDEFIVHYSDLLTKKQESTKIIEECLMKLPSNDINSNSEGLVQLEDLNKVNSQTSKMISTFQSILNDFKSQCTSLCERTYKIK